MIRLPDDDCAPGSQPFVQGVGDLGRKALLELGAPGVALHQLGRIREYGKPHRARLGAEWSTCGAGPSRNVGAADPCGLPSPYAQPTWLRIRTRRGSGRLAPPSMLISSKPSSNPASILLPSTPSGRLMVRRKCPKERSRV